MSINLKLRALSSWVAGLFYACRSLPQSSSASRFSVARASLPSPVLSERRHRSLARRQATHGRDFPTGERQEFGAAPTCLSESWDCVRLPRVTSEDVRGRSVAHIEQRPIPPSLLPSVLWMAALLVANAFAPSTTTASQLQGSLPFQ